MRIASSACAALLFAAFAHAEDARWDARIVGASGDVQVQVGEGAPAAGGAGLPLEDGDSIVVGKGSSVEIALDDGSLITVRENSELKIEKTEKSDASFFLGVGSLLAKIQKLGDMSLRVRTPTAVAAVRGTEFGVETDGDKSYVGVFDEGKVEVSGAAGGAPELLISNQETTVLKGRAPDHAGQLMRFIALRRLMRGHGRRLSSIRAAWKPAAREQRLQMRSKLLEKLREKQKASSEKRAASMRRADEKRRIDQELGRRKRAENLKKMEERRNRVKRGGTGR